MRLTRALALAAMLGTSPIAAALPATADAQPNRIRIEYVAPKSPEHQAIFEMAKERRVLEKLQEIYGAFKLPVDLVLRTVSCDGVSNAGVGSDKVDAVSFRSACAAAPVRHGIASNTGLPLRRP